MTTLVKNQIAIALDTQTCQHYWVIEPPTGPTSLGICKYCRAEREFNNFIEESFEEPRPNDLLWP